MKDNEYKCGQCGNIYEKGRPDEEAFLEAEKNFGLPIKDWKESAVIICDDCYEIMRPDKFPQFTYEAQQKLKTLLRESKYI